MRALMILVALSGAAHAGVFSDAQQGMIFGRLKSETRGDNFDQSPATYTSETIGFQIRMDFVGQRTTYGGYAGGFVDFEMLFFSPGAVERAGETYADPLDKPKLGFMHVGIDAGLALSMFHTKTTSLDLRIGVPLNTDFYGLSGELYFRTKVGFEAGWRTRSGKGWQGTQVFDQRYRVGLGGEGYFFGLELLRGYSEDEMSRANLNSMFKGGYVMTSLVLSKGVDR